MQQPAGLREYFQDRLEFYREESALRGNDAVYQKEDAK
jgi:hypothetical protein